MSIFVMVPCSNKEGKVLEPVRINMDDVGDYREWKNEKDSKQTVFFFKKSTRKKRLIGDIDPKEIDAKLGITGNGAVAEKVEEEAEEVTEDKK